MHSHGYGIDHIQVGWLRPGTDVGTVILEIEQRGQQPLNDRQRCPLDVRPGY